MAVEAASLSTVTLSMSEGLRVVKIDEVAGAPSQMNSGVLPDSELTPRMRIASGTLEGSPVFEKMARPGT